MKIKHGGRYTTYKGKEVRLTTNLNTGEWDYIASKDGSIMDNKSFKKDNGWYIRQITAEEIGETYRVSPYAIYKGHSISIFGMYEDKVILIPVKMDKNDDTDLVKELNMKWKCPGEYELEVPVSEVTIVERVEYFDKYKYLAEEKSEYYRYEDIIVEDPEW